MRSVGIAEWRLAHSDICPRGATPRTPLSLAKQSDSIPSPTAPENEPVVPAPTARLRTRNAVGVPMEQMAGVQRAPTSGRRDLADLRVCCSGTSRRVDSKRPQLSVLTQRLTLVRARIPRFSVCYARRHCSGVCGRHGAARAVRVRFAPAAGLRRCGSGSGEIRRTWPGGRIGDRSRVLTIVRDHVRF